MRTKTIELYTFDELSDEAKEKAREWWREIDDMPLLHEYMNEQAKELLAKHDITDVSDIKVFYSLSYSQGDGAMIELRGKWKGLNVSVEHRGHYYHERSTSISVTTEMGDDVYDDVVAEFEENYYVPACKELRDFGYEAIDYWRSDEVVDETIIANEYEFTSDGEIA